MTHPFTERLARGPILSDGALGTMLHGRGAALDASVEGLTLSQPDWVRDIHLAYIRAGAEIIQTNSFGGSSLRLAESGLDDRMREINFRGVKLAREAREMSGAAGLDRGFGRAAGAAHPAQRRHRGRPCRGLRSRSRSPCCGKPGPIC